MKIAVIGTGYVGLVTGTCLADLGNEVTCVDIDKERILKLKKGISPIFEEGLEDLVKKNLTLPRRGSAAKVESKRLSFETDSKKAVKKAEIIFIAVGTPSKPDGRVDLSYVKQAAGEIGRNIDGYKVIVNKSTVPIGTGDLVSKIIKKYYDGPFDVVSNPEFLREGRAVSDFMHPDRIIIGGASVEAKNILKKIYQPLAAPIVLTDSKTAEMIKYASNSFLAASVSFINSIANLCEKVGADVNEVSKGMKLDKRIGKKAFLDAGPGWGGSCFGKDIKALVQIANENYTEFEILEAALEQNERQKKWMLEKLSLLLPNLKDKHIAVWGLAFKANTDDIRESPALAIIEKLLSSGARVSAYDPKSAKNAQKIFPEVKFPNSAYKTADKADALLILTEWPEFKKLNLKKIKELLRHPFVIDGRNLYAPITMEKLGFQYISVGRQWLEPKVSIIIPLTRFNHYLYKSLKYIMELDWRNFEVLILPDKISDDEKALLEKDGDKIKVIETGKMGPAEKRDLALSQATGAILAFLDDDAYPTYQWLKIALRHFQNPKVGAVAGPAVTPKEAVFWEKVSGAVYESFLGGGTARFRYLPIGEIREVDDFPSVNFLIKKEIFQKLGGFDSQFWPGEDTKLCQDLVYSLGKKIIYDPKVVVFHHRRKTLFDHLKQVSSYALHRGFFVKRFPKTSFRPVYFAPSLFVLWLLGTLGLIIGQFIGNSPKAVFSGQGRVLGASVQSFWTVSPMTIALAVLIIYGFGLLFSSAGAALKHKNPLVGLAAAPVIFLTHFVYGLAFIGGFLKKDLKSRLRE